MQVVGKIPLYMHMMNENYNYYLFYPQGDVDNLQV